MTIPNPHDYPGYSEAYAAVRAVLNASEAEIGDRVSYDDVEPLADQLWADELESLRKRSMCMHDDGSGYVVAWRYAADGSWLPDPVVGEQPATADD